MTKFKKSIKYFIHSNAGAAVMNLLLAYLVFMLSRLAFLAENWSTFSPYLSWKGAGQLLQGSLVFDTSALLYVNALYLLLELLPLHIKERRKWTSGLRWLYVITNGLAVASNLCDAVYFQYTGRRSTVTVFSEFANEGNITSIIFSEFANHWYLVLVMAAIVLLLWRCFTRSDHSVYGGRRWIYYTAQAVSLLVAAPLLIIGIRGSATAGTRPITVSNANQYISRPVEAALVLNTPFSMIRSIGKKPYITPNYMPRNEMEQVYEPIIRPAALPDSANYLGKKNVVILIVESMGKEYVGTLNHSTIGTNYKGYTPFIDSLLTHSLTFEYSFALKFKALCANRMTLLATNLLRGRHCCIATTLQNTKFSNQTFSPGEILQKSCNIKGLAGKSNFCLTARPNNFCPRLTENPYNPRHRRKTSQFAP